MSNRNIQNLRERAAALAKEMKNMLEQQGDRVWDKATQDKYDATGDEFERATNQIRQLEAIAQREAEEADDGSAFALTAA